MPKISELPRLIDPTDNDVLVIVDDNSVTKKLVISDLKRYLNITSLKSFKDIAVAGQLTVEATEEDDTLTMVAGAGIALTTNPTTKSLTIASDRPVQYGFSTINLVGQSDVVAEQYNDTLNLRAGAGISITSVAGTDTITITNTAVAVPGFSNVAVAGQSTVEADTSADTLTLAAGTGISITTNATTDTITIANTAGFGGSLTTNLQLSGFDIVGTGDINITGDTTITGAFESESVSTSSITSPDSSAIEVTPAVDFISDVSVGNNLTVSNNITALGFLSNGIGIPTLSSSTNLNLSAGNAVVISSSPLRLKSYTTTQRNTLLADQGDLIFNVTTGDFEGFKEGSWNALGGGADYYTRTQIDALLLNISSGEDFGGLDDDWGLVTDAVDRDDDWGAI